MNPTRETESDVNVVEAIAGIHRVERKHGVVGFVQESGQRFVSLSGAIFNTSVEVGQSLNLGSAVAKVLRNS